MEVVNRLPKPSDPVALGRLVSAQQILCSRCVSEEDCERAVELLEELAKPIEDGGFNYFPAFLTLASLHEAGFEPAISQDGHKAARYYLKVLTHQEAATGLGASELDEAATQLCSLVKDGKAFLAEEEIGQLQRLSKGEGAGAVGSVASWAQFASMEAERRMQESREDPKVREQREARKKAREEQRDQDMARQKLAAQEALARAEELRLEGNDDYRQGSLSGNSKKCDDFGRAVLAYARATTVLSECLSGLTAAVAEAAEVRKQRGILHSNAAQVQIMVENWAEAAELAQKAIEDDPQGTKPKYRLARAQLGLKEWESAARTVDGALSGMAKQGDREADEIRLELWKIAEDISKAIPSWQWTSSKPAVKEKKAEDDFEKRIAGKWEYGPPGESSHHYYEVVLEKWGALYWKEKDMRIDLLRKGKLRWHGEYEMISGMVLNLSYEPGADMLITEFTAPDDIPEEQRWKGPSKFTARRRAEPEKPPMAEVVTDLDPPPPPGEMQLQPPVEEEKAQETEVLPVGTPQELWLCGQADFAGRYEFLPDMATPGAASGTARAVYRREGSGSPLYLWSRGGNWGVSESLNTSSLGAPFLTRCPDTSGRARHPLEVRRPRWYVRKGRGQEDLDAGVKLQAQPPSASDLQSCASGTATSSTSEARQGSDELPSSISIAGREGSHSDINGRYELSKSSWGGHPVYTQVEPPLPYDQERPLALFFDHGYWAIARGVSSLPRAMARCHPRCAESPHPGEVGGAAWEFLCDNSEYRVLVSTDTRKYNVDRRVVLEALAADGAVISRSMAAPLPSPSLSSSSTAAAAASSTAPVAAAAANGTSQRLRPTPPWVASGTAAEGEGEVRAAIVVRDGIDVDMQNLSLEVGPQVLKIGLEGHDVFELDLPSAVDAAVNPKARWLEKSRTLRIRLALSEDDAAATAREAPPIVDAAASARDFGSGMD
mmetsp:Transcript_115226/g.366263  ORF Transcript_115226/g.366263 Transcript_115226/m.366263 type:complete len:948 (+) Transcript_115226:102-2945(+)